jgi:O-antigen/teichoic acid export membrane protein
VSTRNASWELASNLIKFGAPLLISELSFLLLTYADRYMIVALIGDSALGLYSVGYNLPMYMADILNFSIAYSIVPIFVEIYDKDGRAKTEEFLKQSMNFLLIAIIPMLFGYFAVSKELIVTLASQKYASAYSFSPIILLGTIILGLNNILNAGLYLKKKSIMILAVMLSATLINIGLNFILIPRYGVMGAALSTLAGCIAAMCITIYLSFKYVVVSIDVRTVLYYITVSCIMVLVIQQLSIATVWINLIAKIAVGSLIFFIGLMIRERESLGKITRFYFSKNTL